MDQTPGEVEVWVERTVPMAETRFGELTARDGTPRPTLALGAEEAVGNGVDHVWFRQGEVVVAVYRPEGAALDLAARLLEAVQEVGPWPAPPRLVFDNAKLRVDGTWRDVRISRDPLVGRATSGPLAGLPSLASPPMLVDDQGALSVRAGEHLTVRVWDAWGRGHVVEWTAPKDAP